jgi:hypothetical protein
MTDATYALQQRKQLEQDIEELRANIGRVVRYLDSLPEDPILAALTLRVKTILNVGEPMELRDEDQLDIFAIAVGEKQREVGSTSEHVAEEGEEQMSLIDWGEEMNKKFNDMTVPTKDGLRRLAARESIKEEDLNGSIHEPETP